MRTLGYTTWEVLPLFARGKMRYNTYVSNRSVHGFNFLASTLLEVEMRNATALAAALLIVALCAFSAPAATRDAYNEMSWLDGFTLVVLETNDIPSLHQARAVI